jgi:small neutral amino acid transporter SnatA (MarC family)
MLAAGPSTMQMKMVLVQQQPPQQLLVWLLWVVVGQATALCFGGYPHFLVDVGPFPV